MMLKTPTVCERLESRWLLTTFQPFTSAALTTALNSSQLGDTIILKAGTTYAGQFTLPNKTTGTGWITIQSSALASLPKDGVRVKPSDAANMPKLVSIGSNAAVVVTAVSAHHYKFVGIEFVGPANNSDLVTLIALGTSTTEQSTMASVPHHFIFDRTYMHPNTRNAQIRRAVAMNSASTDITNSYIDEIHQEGSDSQAIAGWNGPGPYNIINNFLEAASENIIFGGSPAVVPGVIPSDIVIRGNHITKNLDWRYGTNGSNVYAVKNLFEMKAGRRVTLEGNIMENNWTSGQTGTAILLKLGQWSSSPQNVTEDVILRNNIIRHANGGVTLQGRDYAENSPAGLVRRLSFVNNVFDDINGKWDSSAGSSGGYFLYLTHGPKDVTFDHNTIFNGYTIIEVDENSQLYPNTNFKFTNNITAHNDYGVRSTTGMGNPTFNKYFSDAGHKFTKNILMGGPASYYTARPGNYFPATWPEVKFVNYAAGNYRLASNSPYKNAGTDGKDIGANIDTLSTATAGAISGVWTNVSAGFSKKINFQLNGSPSVPGYEQDNGDIFGVRRNGLSYGWNKSHTSDDRDRNKNSNQLLDTLLHMQKASTWSINVPNGRYTVKVSVGDPSFTSKNTLSVNGVSYWNNLALGVNQFANKTMTITVTNGKIVLSNGAAPDRMTKLNYIEITAVA